MTKISAFIITKNEAARIAIAINSLKKVVEEIIIIDSGSNDGTQEIAENLGAKVIYHEWEGYVQQKTVGENLCKNDWILNIDADEELSKELQDEIKFIFFSNIQDRYVAYQTKHIILHRNSDKVHFWAPYNKCIRLYNRKSCCFANNIHTSNKCNFSTHDSIIFNSDVNWQNKIYNLNGVIYHRSGISIEQLVAKANFYSSQQAKDLVALNKVPSKIRIATEIISCFFKSFFLRRYFVFGFDGFVDSVIFAFARFMRLAKAREYTKNNNKNNLI